MNRCPQITNGGHLNIRPFRMEDQPVVRQLILQGLGEHFGFIDETLNPDLDDITASYLQPGHVFMVAEWQGRLIGTGALVTASLGVAQMVRVSVCRNVRRQGVGRAIVTHLVQMARERGYQRLQVETNKDWFDAIGLYQGYGFSEYARDEVSVYMSLELDEPLHPLAP